MNFMQYQQPQPQRQYYSPINRIRPVSSFEEVKAASIDFDGSIFYFPDLAHKRIYTKYINIDGLAAFDMYELKEMPSQQVDTSQFITREEFERAIKELAVSRQPPAEQASASSTSSAASFEFR